jgi:hypothetical protein
VDSIVVSRAGVLFEAVLLAPMLRPLVSGAGFSGDYELTLLAQEIAARDTSGFAAVLAKQLGIAP